MPSSNLRNLSDLRATGAPSFFERETKPLVAKFKAKYEKETKKTLFEGQPEMFLIEFLAYVVSIFGEAAQKAVLQNTAVWAEGRHLEDRGANVSIFRLLPQAAKTTLKFTLSQTRTVDTNIAAGFRAANGGAVFATNKDLVIPSGALIGEISATAQAFGSQFNGFEVGAINSALDVLPENVTVSNITPSAGGSEIEKLERFRARVVNGLYLISKAGPKSGYRELAMSVHPDIVDVGVVRPEPGDIALYALMADGSEPAEILRSLEEKFDPETPNRPMGDDVFLHFAEGVLFAPKIAAKSSKAIPGLEATIRAIVTDIFEGWRKETGVQVSPSEIVRRVKQIAHVTHVDVTNMAFTDLPESKYPKLDKAALALAQNVTVEVVENV